MKQSAGFISTYASDASGVCSALYELGGMSVIHDASGCNSTYNTHDEPRWYDMDSLVFISGLSETEAIMGNDEKLISDTVEAVKSLKPRFAALCGTPIPMMTGTDFKAIALETERRSGVPSFGINTNGMHSYISGASLAFLELSKRFLKTDVEKKAKSVNILGLTPLDFSINKSAESLNAFLTKSGYALISSWAMGSSLDEISESGSASVNLVVSYSGVAVAKELKKRFGIPSVYGVPFGPLGDELLDMLSEAEKTGEDKILYEKRKQGNDFTIIGESIYSESLAYAVEKRFGKAGRVICPLETQDNLLLSGDRSAHFEEEIEPLLQENDTVIADPLFFRILPKSTRKIRLPSEGFSGRLYRKEIPNLINADLPAWF